VVAGAPPAAGFSVLLLGRKMYAPDACGEGGAVY
jgi:hypothetical protein